MLQVRGVALLLCGPLRYWLCTLGGVDSAIRVVEVEAESVDASSGETSARTSLEPSRYLSIESWLKEDE